MLMLRDTSGTRKSMVDNLEHEPHKRNNTASNVDGSAGEKIVCIAKYTTTGCLNA